MSQSFPLISQGDGTWKSLTQTFTICNRKYRFDFNRDGNNGNGSATLTRTTGVSGGSDGTVFPLRWAGCACNWVEFAIGDELVCTGPEACGGGCANIAKIRVTQVPCAYTGAGWYCVRACGDTGGFGSLVELSDADAGDPGIEIMTGPYATEEDGAAYCGLINCSGVNVKLAIDVEFRDEFAALGTVRCYLNAGRTAFVGHPTTPRSLPCGEQLDSVSLFHAGGISALGALTFGATFTSADGNAISSGADLAQWPCFYVSVVDGVASGHSADFRWGVTALPSAGPCAGLTGTVRITGVIL